MAHCVTRCHTIRQGFVILNHVDRGREACVSRAAATRIAEPEPPGPGGAGGGRGGWRVAWAPTGADTQTGASGPTGSRGAEQADRPCEPATPLALLPSVWYNANTRSRLFVPFLCAFSRAGGLSVAKIRNEKW